MRTCSPVAMAGQPWAWAGVGSRNAPSNHSRVAGEKTASGSMASRVPRRRGPARRGKIGRVTQVPDHERREAWERVAPGWERRNEGVAQMAAPVARRMVELLDPRPGETILDIAAGVGDTGLLAAARIRPGGRLITSDFASAMLDAARRRAAELGVEDVEFLAADAHDLPLPD